MLEWSGAQGGAADQQLSQSGAHPLTVPLSPLQGSGLEKSSFARAWLPIAVLRQQLQGSNDRGDIEVLRHVLITLAFALDLAMQEKWSEDSSRLSLVMSE